MEGIRERAVALLRWSEKYTKTDMVYLAGAGLWGNLNLVITSVLALLLSIAYANLLPAVVFGTYQFLLSLSAIVTAMTLAGMNNAVSQAVARGYEGVLRDSVRVQLKWSAVPTAAGLAVAGYYFLHGNHTIAIGLVIVALLSPVTNAFNTYGAYLNGKREFRTGFFYSTIIALAYYASIFWAVAFLKNATLLILVNLGVNALATAYVYRLTIRRYQPNDSTDLEAITYGKHLSVMNAFGTIVTQLDSVLVFHFLGAVNLALYTFATSVPGRLGGLSKFISVAALPKFANQSPSEIKKNILPKSLRAGLAGLGLAIVYAFFSPLIFRFLFPQYVDAVPFTQIYALIIATTAVRNVTTTALLAQRLRRELYVYNIIGPIVLLAVEIPLLIYYGILGLLVAKLFADLFNVALSIALLYLADSSRSQIA